MGNNNYKIYLSMPITGYHPSEREQRALDVKKAIKKKWKGKKVEIIAPMDIKGISYDKTWQECMKLCLQELVFCDYVYFDEGWRRSRGCLAEFNVAVSCGIDNNVTEDICLL